VLWLNWG